MMVDIVGKKEFWVRRSGLLPVHLSPQSHDEKYILLDGGRYDFCLDFSEPDLDPNEYYSSAWSSDVKNYIVIKDGKAIIYNWYQPRPETVKLDTIYNKFDSFFNILSSTNIHTPDDVTPFILRLFNKLRNLTVERKEPVEALTLLFKLLQSVDPENPIAGVEVDDVKLPKGFESVSAEFMSGIRDMKPNIELILRHASGPLFEAAQREALYFNTMPNLFGEIPDEIIFSKGFKYSGIHYTPRYLVRSIVENSLKYLDLNKDHLTILDPACGSGAFLQEVLKQLKECSYKGRLTIKGFDESKAAVMSAKFLLEYENKTQWDNQLVLDIRLCNSLETDWNHNDLILMNPPFMSYELLDADSRVMVNEIMRPLNAKKRHNLAAVFFYKAINSLLPSGVIGTVLPYSILLQPQNLPLRDEAKKIVDLKIVAHLGNFVFKDALTDSSFIIAKEKSIATENESPLNIWCENKAQSAHNALRGFRMLHHGIIPPATQEYSIYQPSSFPTVKNTWKVLSRKDDMFLKHLKSLEAGDEVKPLGSIFKVRQGVITGKNSVFEVDRNFYHKLSKKEQKFYRPLLCSKTFNDGQIIEEKYVWYPYNKDGLAIVSEEDLKCFKESYNHLISHKDSLQQSNINKKWWELSYPRVSLFFNTEKLLCSKRYGSSRSFGIFDSQFVVVDGNVFEFKRTDYLERDKYFYLAYFTSIYFQKLLEVYTKPNKSGHDLGAAQIKDIPIIDVAAQGIRDSMAYALLAQAGEAYSQGSYFSQDHVNDVVGSFFIPRN